MISKEFRYYKGTDNTRENVEMDEVCINGIYLTTCIVDVEHLLNGYTVFPCENGEERELDPALMLEVLKFVQEQRDSLTSTRGVKSLKNWIESGLSNFDDFCHPEDIVDKSIVDYFMNILPPVTLCDDCTQPGGSFSSFQGPREIHNTYRTFSRFGNTSDLWKFEGYCYKGETANRLYAITKIERRMKELQGLNQVHQNIRLKFDETEMNSTVNVFKKVFGEIIEELKEESIISDDYSGNRAVEIILSHLDAVEVLAAENQATIKELLSGDWVESKRVETALGMTFKECFSLFEFSRTVEWWSFVGETSEERARNGQKITCYFKLRKNILSEEETQK